MIKYDDWQFVSRFSDEHKDNPRCAAVKGAILRLLEKHPKDRFDWAQEALYDTPRTGYVIRGVPDDMVESVGDHTLSAIELCFDYIPAGEQRDKVQAMIALHDLAEAVVGDFTPHDPITKAEKTRLETIAAGILFQKHPDLMELWLEFEHAETPEAKIAHDIEKNQILFQTLDCVHQKPDLMDNLEDLFANAHKGQARTSVGLAMKADALGQWNKLLISRGNAPEISIQP